LNTDPREATNEKERSVYYREIARRFFRQRGSPFSLSPRDLAVIARWEEMRIPLSIVLEGIDKAFDFKQRGPRRDKVYSLSYCDGQVRKLHDQYRDGRVGGERRIRPSGEKKMNPAAIILAFLESLPADLEPLRNPCLRALSLYDSGGGSEEEWERLDGEVEETIVALAGREDCEAAKNRASSESGTESREEQERISRTKLAKSMRKKHRIPYFSPFYY